MVKNGVVENVSIWDGVTPWDPGSGYVLVDVSAETKIAINATYDGTDKFTDTERTYTGMSQKVAAIKVAQQVDAKA